MLFRHFFHVNSFSEIFDNFTLLMLGTAALGGWGAADLRWNETLQLP